MAKSNLATSRLWTDWRSQDLIEVLPAAVYVCDAEAVVVAYNRRAAELWGREPALGDTDQKYCGAHRLFRPDGSFLPHHETPMEWVLRTGEPARDMEVVIERPDASRITALVNIAPLFSEEGELVGAVNCFQDVTARKDAEEDRIRLAEELHQAKKIEALGQVTAGVAHDFNNLLTAILGNLEFVMDRTTEAESLRLLGNAIRSARRGAELNNRLLRFARKHALLPELTDLNQLIIRMADLVKASIGDAIRLETRMDGEAWPALVDPNEIELVVLNLAINAHDAMPQGGTLTIGTRNASFGASDPPDDLAAGDYVVLSISDTGTGMSEEVRAKAFEPFFTTKGPGKGSGLGLSMALDVARQSGGGVRLNSRLGEGTSIEVYLPRAGREASYEDTDKGQQVHAPVVSGQVILVVDDDDDVREVTATMLDLFGYSIIEAKSGAAAIEILKNTGQVDLMLIDLAMPGMNGIEAARQAWEGRPDLAVLFSTGYLDADHFGGGDIDPNHIVSKPYRQEELSRKIRACLEE